MYVEERRERGAVRKRGIERAGEKRERESD